MRLATYAPHSLNAFQSELMCAIAFISIVKAEWYVPTLCNLGQLALMHSLSSQHHSY